MTTLLRRSRRLFRTTVVVMSTASPQPPSSSFLLTELDLLDEVWGMFLSVPTAGLKTMATVAWNELYTHLIEADALDRFRLHLDVDGAYQVADAIEHEDFDVYMWGANDVDESGHDFAFSPESPEYMKAIYLTDGRIGQLVDAIERRETRD